MADFDRGNRNYPSLYRRYIMRCARVPNRVHFIHIWLVIVVNCGNSPIFKWHRPGSRSQISLDRVLYMPDKLNLYIWAGEKKKVSPCHFLRVAPELIQSLR